MSNLTLSNEKDQKTLSTKNIDYSKNFRNLLMISPNDSLTKAEGILQQPINDTYSLLMDYYSKKNSNSNFLDKIKKLNKKFYDCSEKYIISKSNIDKLNDELYLNLFTQIDCYVKEIQRLNTRLNKIDNNKDYLSTIKNLNKEILENKNIIRNLKEKINKTNMNEEKLLKEIESYKRRIIFYKDKIKIYLGSRPLNHNYYNNYNNIKNNKKGNLVKIKNNENKRQKFLSSSPKKKVKLRIKISDKIINFASQQMSLKSSKIFDFKGDNDIKITSPLVTRSDNQIIYSEGDIITKEKNETNKTYKLKESIFISKKIDNNKKFEYIVLT